MPIEHGAPPELRVTDTVFWYGAQTDFASTGRELLLVTRFDVGGGDTVQGSPPWLDRLRAGVDLPERGRPLPEPGRPFRVSGHDRPAGGAVAAVGRRAVDGGTTIFAPENPSFESEFKSSISQVGISGFVNTLGTTLAPLYGIMIVDDYLIMRQQLVLKDRYSDAAAARDHDPRGWKPEAARAHRGVSARSVHMHPFDRLLQFERQRLHA